MDKKSIKKIVTISIVLVLILIIGISIDKMKTTQKESRLSEIKTIACNTADEVGSCDTRLSEVGIVSKEECCQYLGKCCGGV